jgi:hypothetical protein
MTVLDGQFWDDSDQALQTFFDQQHNDEAFLLRAIAVLEKAIFPISVAQPGTVDREQYQLSTQAATVFHEFIQRYVARFSATPIPIAVFANREVGAYHWYGIEASLRTLCTQLCALSRLDDPDSHEPLNVDDWLSLRSELVDLYEHIELNFPGQLEAMKEWRSKVKLYHGETQKIRLRKLERVLREGVQS